MELVFERRWVYKDPVHLLERITACYFLLDVTALYLDFLEDIYYTRQLSR